jgi:hypothetical protein
MGMDTSLREDELPRAPLLGEQCRMWVQRKIQADIRACRLMYKSGAHPQCKMGIDRNNHRRTSSGTNLHTTGMSTFSNTNRFAKNTNFHMQHVGRKWNHSGHEERIEGSNREDLELIRSQCGT